MHQRLFRTVLKGVSRRPLPCRAVPKGQHYYADNLPRQIPTSLILLCPAWTSRDRVVGLPAGSSHRDCLVQDHLVQGCQLALSGVWGEEEIQFGTPTFPDHPTPGTFQRPQWRCLRRQQAPRRFRASGSVASCLSLRGPAQRAPDTEAGLLLWHLCLRACAPPFLAPTLPPPHRNLAKKVPGFVVAGSAGAGGGSEGDPVDLQFTGTPIGGSGSTSMT